MTIPFARNTKNSTFVVLVVCTVNALIDPPPGGSIFPTDLWEGALKEELR